jgi:hypothetical protein
MAYETYAVVPQIWSLNGEMFIQCVVTNSNYVSCIQADSLHTHTHVYIVFRWHEVKYAFTTSVLKCTEGSGSCSLCKLDERTQAWCCTSIARAVVIFVFAIASPCVMGPTQPSIWWLSGLLLRKVKTTWNYIAILHTASRFFLKHRGNLTVICKIWGARWGESEQYGLLGYEAV